MMVCAIALRSPLSDPRRVLTCPERRRDADTGCGCFASVSPIAAVTGSRTDRERSGSDGAAGTCPGARSPVGHVPSMLVPSSSLEAQVLVARGTRGHRPLGAGRVAEVRWLRTGRGRGIARCRTPGQWPVTEPGSQLQQGLAIT
jgi:hypothetical protein